MRNPVRQVVGSGVILMILATVAIVFLLREGIKIYNELENNVDEVVGAHVVIEGDTLLVRDYLWYNDNFVLNDGTQISADLLDDLEVLP